MHAKSIFRRCVALLIVWESITKIINIWTSNKTHWRDKHTLREIPLSLLLILLIVLLKIQRLLLLRSDRIPLINNTWTIHIQLKITSLNKTNKVFDPSIFPTSPPSNITPFGGTITPFNPSTLPSNPLWNKPFLNQP